jgi:hypothetical protein
MRAQGIGPNPAGIIASRRLFLALSASAIALGVPRLTLAGALPENRTFRVFHDGSEIGTHQITFTPEDKGFAVDVDIDIAVKIAFITAYRYNQKGRDRWVDGRLVGADYRTDDNGKVTTLLARSEDGRLMVDGASGRLELPPGTMTDLGFWNEAILHAPVIVDSQTGEAGLMKAGGGTPDQITIGGTRIDAMRYPITAPKGRSGSVWYSPDGHWVKAQIVTRGETLDYELA